MEYKLRTNIELQKIIDINIASKDDIDVYNQTLIDILSTSASSCIPSSRINPYTKPGWTKAIKKLHATERVMRRKWIQEGRPRGMQHDAYRNYKRANRAFRNAHDKEY